MCGLWWWVLCVRMFLCHLNIMELLLSRPTGPIKPVVTNLQPYSNRIYNVVNSYPYHKRITENKQNKVNIEF